MCSCLRQRQTSGESGMLVLVQVQARGGGDSPTPQERRGEGVRGGALPFALPAILFTIIAGASRYHEIEKEMSMQE